MLDAARTSGPFHIGVLLENVPEYMFLLAGAALARATVVGVNPTRRGDELAARDIRHTDCQLVLTDAAHRPLLEGLDLGIDREPRDRRRRSQLSRSPSLIRSLAAINSG